MEAVKDSFAYCEQVLGKADDSTLGQAVAMPGGQTATRGSAMLRLVAVAPGITKFGVTGAAPPECPWLIVQGDADDVVPPQVVLAWSRTLVPAPEVVVLPGAGHFFHGRINDLRETVLAFMGRAVSA